MALKINNALIGQNKQIIYNGQIVKCIKYNNQKVWEYKTPTYMVNNDHIIDRHTIERSMSVGKAVLNLTNGKFRFIHLDTSEGQSSYHMEIYHVYHSALDYDNVINDIRTYMGEGLKLNVQEYLVYHNDKYVYIDGLGNAIDFGYNNNVYYDTAGLGLSLMREEDQNIITDKENNKSYFNMKGYITQKTTKFNTTFFYTYENNKLVKIQKDSDNSGFKFTYHDTNGLLKRIESIYPNANKINFTYQDDKLIRVYKSASLKEREIIEYQYNEKGKLEKVLDKSKLGLMFFYDSSNRCHKISNIVIKSNGEIIQDKYIFIMYEYTHLGKTEVKNEKEIRYVYTFNKTTLTKNAIYEDASQINNTVTITSVEPSINTGIRVLPKAPKHFKSFNGCKNINLILEGSSQCIDVDKNEENRIKKILNFPEIKRKFTISAWVRLNLTNKNGKMNLRFSTNSLYGIANIDLEKNDFFQFVSCEIQFPETGSIKYLQTQIEKTGTISGNIEIADIRIIYNDIQPILKSAENTIDLRDVEGIKVQVNGKTKDYSISDVRSINPEYFLTPRDIQTTMFNYYQNLGGVFNVSLNNGKKLIGGVSSIDYCGKDRDFPLVQNSKNNPFFYMESTMDGKLNIKNYEYYTNINNQSFLHQITIAEKEGNESSLETKYNLKGLVVESVDEYKVRSFYEYNAAGNLVRKIIKNDQSTVDGEQIIEEYKYTDRENLSQIKDQRSNENQYYFSVPYNNLNAYVDYNKTSSKESEFDEFQENTLSSSQYVKEEGASSLALKNKVAYTYDNTTNVLKKMANNNTTFEMVYNAFNQISAFKINNDLIYSKEYFHDIYETTKVIYQNDLSKEFISQKDEYGREHKTYENNNLKTEFLFQDFDGLKTTSGAKLRQVIDNNSGFKHKYHYNEDDTLTRYTCEDINDDKYKLEMKMLELSQDYLGESKEYYFECEYDKHFCLSKYLEGNDFNIFLQPRLKHINENNETYEVYNYDKLGRLLSIWNYHFNRYTVFEYYNNEKNKTVVSTTNLIKKVITYENDIQIKEIEYGYDKNQNITSIKTTIGDTSNTINYKYNASNEIIQINDSGTITNIVYDNYGNIISRTTHMAATTTYSYGNSHKDRLVSISDSYGTKTITYDNIGNPINYLGKTLQWEKGNQLKAIDNCIYTYSKTGIRTKKTIGNYVKRYFLDEDKVLAETDPDGIIKFDYTKNGISGMNYKGERYIFEKDILGNIVAMYEKSLNCRLIATFRYDEFGKCSVKASSINDRELADKMPFRWKGHYYDIESGFYYINGNYYDPLTGRYLTTASLDDIICNMEETELNLYAFASNNHLMAMPSIQTHEFSITLIPEISERSWLQIIFSLIISLVLLALSIICAIYSGNVAIMVISITLIAVELGLITMHFADAIESKTGNNFIQDGFGWNQSKYDKIRRGLIIAKVVLIVELFICSLLRFQCFAKGTKVLTKEGSKPIEEIEIGDEVLSFNEETGETDYKEVVRLFRNKASTKTQLTIKAEDGTIDEITSTPGHKYYLPDNKVNRNPNEKLEHASYDGLNEKWVSACLLKKGDRVLLANAADSLTGKPKFGIVIGVKTEECEEFMTYNFEVADFHTYYVGENGVCVHNAACDWEWSKGSFDSVDDSLSSHTWDHAEKLKLSKTDTAGYFKKATNVADNVVQGKIPGKLDGGFTPNVKYYDVGPNRIHLTYDPVTKKGIIYSFYRRG